LAKTPARSPLLKIAFEAHAMSKDTEASQSNPAIAIIGPGKVGTALAVLAARFGGPVAAIGGRDIAKARSSAAAAGPDVLACNAAEAAALGDLVIIAVTDRAIGPVCDDLAAARAFRDSSVVAHCSGSLDSSVLHSAKAACGCHVGSMHPLQTFPTVGAAIAGLPGAYFFCEGDPKAVQVLQHFAARIAGIPATIQSGQQPKALYHASAVMACNYMATLADSALKLAVEAGMDKRVALEALGPLMQATIANVSSMGPAKALTGPIARGDIDTVARHLQSLADCGAADEVEELYRTAGIQTVALALEKGTIGKGEAKKLRDLLRPALKER